MSYLNNGMNVCLMEAIAEAERFILAASAAVNFIESQADEDYPVASSKHVAAAKRASMDLTRKLVFVRR